jgi:hypothetical protein
MAAFGARGSMHGSFKLDSSKGSPIYFESLTMYNATEEEFREVSEYHYARTLKRDVTMPNGSGRILIGVACTLKSFLPYGCGEAGIVRVRWHDGPSQLGNLEFCNLLY